MVKIKENKRINCNPEINYECNPCKILTPNYGPKMGYENISRKENIREEAINITKKDFKTIKNNIFNAIYPTDYDKMHIIEFIYDEDTNNTIKIDKTFSDFVKKMLDKRQQNPQIPVNKIIFNKNIIINNEEIIVNGKTYNMNKIVLDLKGPITVGGTDSNNPIEIEYNVSDYKGLFRCDSIDDSIENSPIIQNLIVKDTNKIINERIKIENQIELKYKDNLNKLNDEIKEKIEKIDEVDEVDEIAKLKVQIADIKKKIADINSKKAIQIRKTYINKKINTLFRFVDKISELWFKSSEIFYASNSTLLPTSGFLVQSLSSYFKLHNCINKIAIVDNRCGGLCGSFAGCFGNCELNECSNSGFIYGNYAGGLCGIFAGIFGICTLNKCFNSGNIYGFYAGGLCGIGAGNSNLKKEINNDLLKSKCLLNKCENIGDIYGYQTGGLCGSYAGGRGGNCSLSDCENSGSIYGSFAGGLYGSGAGNFFGECSLISCKNSGYIYGDSAGGLCGQEAGRQGNCSLSVCKNRGFIYGYYAGGLCGDYAGSYGGNCLLNDCENSGSIYGDYAGGLCGIYAGDDGGTIIIKNNSINKGLIKNENAGQLLGSIQDGAKLIYISIFTKILEDPNNNKKDTIQFKKDTEEQYKILGENTNYNLITQEFNLNIGIIPENLKDKYEEIINDIFKDYEEDELNKIKNGNYIFFQISEEKDIFKSILNLIQQLIKEGINFTFV